MLEWFSDNPFEDLITILTRMFVRHSPSTKIIDFEITNEPEWLTGGRKIEDDNKVIVTRSGMAVACDLTLQDNNGTYKLNGIFTWVGVNLDTNPITNMWMDLDGSMEEFGKDGLLNERIYGLEA